MQSLYYKRRFVDKEGSLVGTNLFILTLNAVQHRQQKSEQRCHHIASLDIKCDTTWSKNAKKISQSLILTLNAVQHGQNLR